MKLEKSDKDNFLFLWIQSDPELWSELREIQIQLLVDRMINELTYMDLAVMYRTTPRKIKEIIDAILVRIDKTISVEVARHLRTLNKKLNAKADKPFSTIQVFLN